MHRANQGIFPSLIYIYIYIYNTHKWWLRRAFVRKIPTGETAHFKCNIKQSARLSQRILCNEACECPCNSLQPFRTFKDYFTEGLSGLCVWGIGSKQNTCVSKANSASSHIWLKTKLRIDSEILRIDPESLKRESWCIDGSIFSSHPYAVPFSRNIQKINSNQTLNSKLNIDEPLKAIKVIDFLFFILFLD